MTDQAHGQRLTGLLPCPFCGPGESQVDTWFDDVSKRWAIGCGRCGASSGRSVHAEGSKEAAIKAWNTRPVPAPVGLEREETRNVTDEDREYASELLADLANPDLPRAEIASRWFRKARYENFLRWSALSPDHRTEPASAPIGQAEVKNVDH